MPTIGNGNYDYLLTTTAEKYAREKLTDNIFTARPLTWWLTEKNRVRFLDGGTKILEPLIYGTHTENTNVGSYSGTDTLGLNATDKFTAAEYDWKQYYATVTISGIEEAKNNGEAEIINLLEAKMMQAEESTKEYMNKMLFGDGTGNSNKDWNGLGNIVESGADLGNINYTDNSWWRSYEENTTAALTIPYMTTAYNTVAKGNDKPDFIMTTQTLFEKYESLVQPALRYTDTKTADAGFENLMFKTAPIMFDSYCTSGVMYFLNSKYLGLVGHKNVWFKHRGWTQPDDKDVRYMLLLSYGNFVCRNRARQGKLTGKS